MLDNPTDRLRQLPPIDALLKDAAVIGLLTEHGRPVVANWARVSLDQLRQNLLTRMDGFDRAHLRQQAVEHIHQLAEQFQRQRLGRVINATGVVLHTNLGRAPLADRAIAAVQEAARYGNVEMDLESGERRYRGHQLDELWRDLTGADAALVVNNCAAATLLALQALAVGREVIVSRGQLIEIGGSYRLPDVFTQSGALLREVGTTNRTRVADYAQAIGPATTALLRVHPSNFCVVGFVETVAIEPLVELAHAHGLFAIDDIGSGCMVDLRPYGLPAEPTVQASLAAGADLVLFSGDKLLGGPQSGILLGKKPLIQRVKQSPLARALRIDKLTLAALQATLEIHRAGRALEEIPVLRQLTQPLDLLHERCQDLVTAAVAAGIRWPLTARPGTSAVGGGSLPMAELPTWLVALAPANHSTDAIARQLRTGVPRVVARVEQNTVLLDLRTVLPGEDALLVKALQGLSQV